MTVAPHVDRFGWPAGSKEHLAGHSLELEHPFRRVNALSFGERTVRALAQFLHLFRQCEAALTILDYLPTPLIEIKRKTSYPLTLTDREEHLRDPGYPAPDWIHPSSRVIL